MDEITLDEISAKINEVKVNGDGTHRISFDLDKEMQAVPGQYVIYSFKRDDTIFEHKHVIKNKYDNVKKIEEDINFEKIEEEFFLPILKSGEVFIMKGPFNFTLKEKLLTRINIVRNAVSKNRAKVLIAFVIVILAIFFREDIAGRIFPVKLSEANEAIRLSTNAEDQKPLQDYLVEQIKAGKNDDETKAALFWITHRFFDNGGNIYEIYDFINARPELAFLKEAERIYPEAFDAIRDKKVKSYDMPSALALLAYFQIANKYNYAGLAMLGMLSNKYAEISTIYMNAAAINKDKNGKLIQEQLASQFLNISRGFSMKTNMYLNEKMNKTGTLKDLESSGIREDDIVVGLNQFASAQLFYRGLEKTQLSKFKPEEIFAFNVEYSRRKLPRLYFFSNYLWAVSLVNGKSATPESVLIPLANVIEYGGANKNDARAAGSLLRVINSNTRGEKSIFSHENTKALAEVSKPFKDWLIESGWKDQDFK